MNFRFKDKVVWITGASTGIGAALAQVFACEGARLVLHSRTMEELDEIAKYCEKNEVNRMFLAFDLARPNDYASLVKQVTDHFGRIDVLINNAGISQRALAHETSIEVDRKIFEINYFGAIQLTKAVLPVMLAQGGGHIAATNSISGLFGWPLRSAYAGAKHAVSGFYETLGIELRKQNIFVTMVYGGRVNTDISLRALQKDGKEWGAMDRGQARGVDPRKFATRYMTAVYRKKRVRYIGKYELLLVCFKRFFPRLFYRIASRVDPNS